MGPSGPPISLAPSRLRLNGPFTDLREPAIQAEWTVHPPQGCDVSRVDRSPNPGNRPEPHQSRIQAEQTAHAIP